MFSSSARITEAVNRAPKTAKTGSPQSRRLMVYSWQVNRSGVHCMLRRWRYKKLALLVGAGGSAFVSMPRIERRSRRYRDRGVAPAESRIFAPQFFPQLGKLLARVP